MTLAAALILLPLASFAAGNAPGAHLWPEEPRYEATVIELAVIGPVDLMGTRTLPPGEYCGLTRECGDWYQRQPAPVPLPWPGLLLTAAIAAIIWKGMRR
jgi:hypothetical protein